MKEEPAFDKTPEFQHFKEVMRGVLSLPKKRLDELVQLAKASHAESEKAPSTNQRLGPKKKAAQINVSWNFRTLSSSFLK